MTVSKKTLVELRNERGWSQEKLAIIAGLSERTIQRVESGGTCSPDTKLALASAFEIPPKALGNSDKEEPHKENTPSNPPTKYTLHWGGILGLFVLGLLSPILILLTGTKAEWELACAGLVIGMSCLLSILSHGALNTYQFFDNSSWIVKRPSHIDGLSAYIVHANLVIKNAYIVGIIASLVSALAIAVHTPIFMDNKSYFYLSCSKPLFYSIVFIELWIRPYKHVMETMLEKQNES